MTDLENDCKQKKHDFTVAWNRRIKVTVFQRIRASNTAMRSGELCIRILG